MTLNVLLNLVSFSIYLQAHNALGTFSTSVTPLLYPFLSTVPLLRLGLALKGARPGNSMPGLSQQTLIIIIACAVGGGLILVILLYRATRSCHSRNVVPLPPIQPLAHQREHQLAQFEASFRANDSSFLAAPPIPYSPHLGSPSSQGSKTSLLGGSSSPHTSYAPTSEGTEELANLSPLEPPDSSLSIPHSASSTPGSSSIHLNDSPSRARAATPRSHSKSLSRLSRDYHAQSYHHRPLSVSSSLSRIGSRRGTPHGPHSQIQIVLPAPLASGIAPSLDDSLRSRPLSTVDRWVPAGRDSIFESFTSQAPPRTPRRFSSAHYTGAEYTPPVPRVPSMYENERQV